MHNESLMGMVQGLVNFPPFIHSLIHYCCFTLLFNGILYLTTDLVYITFVEYSLISLLATVMFFYW
jgi:hypothetical protein